MAHRAATTPPPPRREEDQRIFMRGVTWSEYEVLLAIERSALLPELDLELLASFLDRPSQTRAVRDFRAALAATP